MVLYIFECSLPSRSNLSVQPKPQIPAKVHSKQIHKWRKPVTGCHGISQYVQEKGCDKQKLSSCLDREDAAVWNDHVASLVSLKEHEERAVDPPHSSLFLFLASFAFSIEGAGLILRTEFPPSELLLEAPAAAA